VLINNGAEGDGVGLTLQFESLLEPIVKLLPRW
jgi:hypothetical protein